MAEVKENETLDFHLKEVLGDARKFENAAQAVTRMILEKGVEEVNRGGKTTYDFPFFRQGKKHIIGWFDELNEFVNFVKDAAEGGSSRERALVFVSEPGSGKTFLADDYLCWHYRRFLTRPENRRYTFDFVNMRELGIYGKIDVIQSQTFEDPMILAMNLSGAGDESKERLAQAGFSDAAIEKLHVNYRPLGACTRYIWNDIRRYCGDDIEKMLTFVRVVSVPVEESDTGIVTTKYSARDKITSSADDLLGTREDLKRTMQLSDTSNPYTYNVRRGALARVGGGGIHFSDELFRNKPDFVQIYLQVIQNRNIELDGFKWPIDALIIGSSNNNAYNEFVTDAKEAPVKDRCQLCYVTHNTDYKLQRFLTEYAIGSGGSKKVTITGEPLHEDPNLNYALSVSVALTRLLESDKLTPVEMMKLEAGDIAGEKSVKTLAEIKETANKSQDVTKRWGQKGIGHRGVGRTIHKMLALPETHKGKCLFARDCFRAMEREILDHVTDATDRDKFMKDLAEAKKLYRTHVKTSIFNAYLENPEAIVKEVLGYINMIVGIGSDKLGPDKLWKYIDPQTGEPRSIKVDERFIDSVESRLGKNTKEQKESFRDSMRKIHGQKVSTDPNYNFMDNESLVKAVTDVRLKSDVAGAPSLMGALANQTNEENVRLRNRMIDVMFNTLGYCNTCAMKTLEYYCEEVDES